MMVATFVAFMPCLAVGLGGVIEGDAVQSPDDRFGAARVAVRADTRIRRIRRIRRISLMQP